MSIQKDPFESYSKKKTYIALLIFIIFSLYMITNSEKTRNVFWIIIALIAMVLVHEAGHLIAAKLTKLKVTEYFAGFGPRIWSIKKGETEYGIKAIPLGGYVKIIGMSSVEEIDAEEEHRTYRSAPTWRKLVVISAGVFANFLTAFIILMFIFNLNGVTDINISKNVVGSVVKESPAYKANIKPSDKILEINGKKINSFENVSQIIRNSNGEMIQMKLQEKNQKIKQISIKPIKKDGSYIIGIGAKYKIFQKKLSLLESTKASYNGVKNVVTLSIKGIGKYANSVVHGEAKKVDRPSSIIGIVDIGAEVTKKGFIDFLIFIATINIGIGALNALPLLPLDGGHALIAIFEKVASIIARRKVTVGYKIITGFSVIVFVLLMSLFFYSAYFDVKKIIN